MEMPLLKRPDWWLPAIVICVLWVIDVLGGNTFLETLIVTYRRIRGWPTSSMRQQRRIAML
jgi:hypothetical protein